MKAIDHVHYRGVKCKISPPHVFDEVLANFTRFKTSRLRLHTVVDIGAHVGSLSLLCAQDGAYDVTAYEPYHTDALIANIKRNNGFLHVIDVDDRAVMREGGRDIHIVDIGYEGCQGVFYPGESAKKVKTVAFCDVLSAKQFIDYLKIDVEGAEFNFFVPSSDVLRLVRERVGFIDIECHSFQSKRFTCIDLQNPAIDDYYRCKWHDIAKKMEKLLLDMDFRIVDEYCAHFLAIGPKAKPEDR